MIALDAVTVLKGGRAALSRCSVEIPKGSFVSLVGPSGAGKTTLLRAVAGLDPLASGKILLDGKVSMVFQDLALWPHKTVEGNLLLALAGTPMSRLARRTRTAEALSRWGLSGFEERYPHTLSGGERQRAAMARAWVLGRPVLLLDEPASALDRPAREALMGELRRVQKAEGLTIVYVTHQQDEALRVSDRIVVLMNGRVAQAGSRDDLMDRPASAEVAAFLTGSMA